MPPEPLPWDRKDFFRERKNERSLSENLGGGGGSSRWRDTPSHHHRWGSAEFRRPPGYGKQGGWHMFPEDSFHGSGPTRSNDKILDDERGRPFGKYGRSSSRENRGGPGPVSQREWKGHCWDGAGTAPPNESARMQADVNKRRSVDDMLTYNSHNHSDFGNTWDQLQFKDQNDKNGGVNDSSTGQRFERENSLCSIDWKPLKWTRSGSLSSRGSGFSHSSSSKSMGVDSTETKVQGHPQNVSPLQSPSGNDAAACVTSAAPSEETTSRKKPRLGWGEGLAKYEKKKVDVPDETAEKNEVVICESNIEPVHCHISNVLDRSPRIQGFLECESPATPSSVACSSSPGLEDKTSIKTVNVDAANLCGSPCPESQNQSDGVAFNLENLEVTTVANLSSSLSELLQSDNPCSLDSGFVRSTAMNKLLVLKADISKKLEVTESEIDSLENELKSLISEAGTACPRPASSSSLPVVCIWKPSEEPCAASSLIPRPAPLLLHSSGDMIMETILGTLEGELAETKDEDIDSPGTATSKFAEPLSLGKPVSEEDILKHDECLGNVDTSGTKDIEVKSTVYTDNEESTGVTSGKHIASNSCRILSTDVGLRRENILCDLIMAYNKDSAHRASEVFNKALPANLSCVDISRFDSSPSWKNKPLVKEKFVMRKRFLMFKERVITLKFRAFQHLWKEDLRLLSMRRCRAKSQKKFELSLRMSHSGCQKHRSTSIRSRFSSPAGNLSLVPTTEVINFASKLLADSHVKMYRSALKMPALILDKKEMKISKFTSTNGLVEDPCATEKERCMINPWTSIEKEVFLDKLATFGKDFRKIASFLDHKTTADCVEFYYKNHKSDCFQKTKKPEFAKQGKSYSTNTYLVTSSKRWNRDNSAASLDILGAASAIAANVDDGLKDQQKCTTRFFFGSSCDSKTTRGNTGMLERSSSFDILVNDRETVAADVLAGICGSLSLEAMSSCITSSIDLGEGYQEGKSQIVGSLARRPLTPEVTQNVGDETCSDESCGEMDPSDWTDEEKSIFIQAVVSYGKDFTMISRCVRTRSMDQCKVFFSKARKCLGLDVMRPGPCNEGTAASDDANGGGGSDTEDDCFVENGSVICNDKQGSKKEEDLPSSNLKASRDEIYPAGAIHMHPELDQLEEDNRKGELDVQDTELRSENIVSDECAEDKVDLDLEGYSNIENCVGRESLSLNVIENGFAISGTKSGQNQAIEHCTLEESVIGQEDNDDGKSSVSVAEVESKSEGEVYTDNSRTEKAGHELLLGISSLNDKRVGIADVNLNDLSGINCSVQGTRTVSLPAGNASVSVDTDSLGIGVLPAYEHRNVVKLDHAQNPHVDSGKECNGYVLTSFMLQDPAAVQHEKNLNHDVELKIHSEKIRNKLFQNSAISDDSYQHICGHALLDHVDPSKILRGYPVSMTTKNGTNGDIGCNKPASLHTISEVDRNFHSGRFLPKDLHLEKCGSKHYDAGAEHSLSQDQLKDHPRKPKPQFSSDSDKPTHNGDVKLFGQILSHPPTQQKPNSRVQEKEDRGSQHAKLSDNSFNLKFTGNQNVDGIFASAKFDRNSYLGLENLPVRRSFGFWDGNRIQTGFPSLPDSAMLLAKYPAAFSNYPMSSSKVEQQHLHSSIVRSNDCNLNGATLFPTREISGSKGVTDFQAYRSRDCTKLQPYTLDLKQCQDMFLSEMQIRGNEFDAVSSIQQARGMVGINVVGRGAIRLGGGPCTGVGVSDPVAAIKMHYAKTEQYGGQPGSIIREEESWRSNGDVGR